MTSVTDLDGDLYLFIFWREETDRLMLVQLVEKIVDEATTTTNREGSRTYDTNQLESVARRSNNDYMKRIPPIDKGRGSNKHVQQSEITNRRQDSPS